MDPCFEATDEAIDIAQDYLILRAKLKALQKKIEDIRKKIDSRGHNSVITNLHEYHISLAYLINMSELSLAEILNVGREISYNAEQIDKAMNMEDEQ